MRQAAENRRARWMAAFETAVGRMHAAAIGRIDWDTAAHLYNQGLTADEAANQYVSVK